MTVHPDLPPLLLPRPQRVEFTGGRVHIDCALAAEQIDPGAGLAFAGPEAYQVRITQVLQAPLIIVARTQAGIRCARATLAQLVRQYGEILPCMVIDDGPMFANRGYMLDISRDRVPTMDHLREIVDVLASLKYNHLQLYTEHTFAYAGHEDVWRDASPMMPDEVRSLDEYCQQRGIELAANQNCFGHLSSWLCLPRYAPLAETHGGWFFESAGERWPRRGPFSLCPTDPASLALVEDLLGQLLPCVTSPLVNIGCDETFDVGFGRSADAVRERGRSGGGGDKGDAAGRAAVYFEFVNAVARLVRKSGKRPMLWADIALNHPELLAEMPDDAVALAWNYEPGAPWALWLERLAHAKIQRWVCPGTSTWRSIVGRSAEHTANIDEAARDGVAGAATGLLLTDWGDSGHRQQWPISLNPIARGAEAGWGGALAGEGGDVNLRAASFHVWGDSTLAAAGWCDSLGNVDQALRRICGGRRIEQKSVPLRNASALYVDLHVPLHTRGNDDAKMRNGIMSASESMWRETAEHLADLRDHMPTSLSAQVTRELEHTLRVAQLAAQRAVLRHSPGRASGSVASSEIRLIADELQTIVEEHRDLWRLRSRPGGLDSSCGHYHRMIQAMQAMQDMRS